MDSYEAFSKLDGLEADDIARFLKDQGIVGVKGDPAACVISRYMVTMTGAQACVASPLTITVWEGPEYFDVVFASPASPAVAEFIRRFDDGAYPELVEEVSF